MSGHPLSQGRTCSVFPDSLSLISPSRKREMYDAIKIKWTWLDPMLLVLVALLFERFHASHDDSVRLAFLILVGE